MSQASQPSAGQLRTFRILACLFVGLAMALSATVLYGWAREIEIFKTLLPGRPDMKANTALCLLTLGLAIGVTLPNGVRRRSWRHWLCVVLSLFTFVFSVLVLLEYVFPLDFGIDHLLFVDTNTKGHSPPGRFAPTTAVNFILLSVGMLASYLPWRAWARFAQSLFMLCFLVALPSFIGTLLGIQSAFGMGYFIPMAVHTALAFTLLSSAFLLSRASEGYMERFTADTPSAIMARRFLIAVIFVPPMIRGFADFAAGAGFFSHSLAPFLHAMGVMVFMSMVVVTTSGALLSAERERERLRERERAAYREAQAERDLLYDVFLNAPTHVDIYKGPDHVAERIHPLTTKAAGGRDIHGLKLRDIFPMADEKGIVRACDEAYRHGTTSALNEISLVVSQANESRVLTYNISIQPWRKANGEIEGVILFSIDVTDQVQARRLIEQSREDVRRHANQLKLVTDALPSLISYVDCDLEYVLVNEAYQKTYGHPKSYFIGRKIRDTVPATTFERAKSHLERALEGETVKYLNETVNQEGEQTFVDVTLVPDKDREGRTRGIVELAHDITQAQRIQNELQRAKDKAEEASRAKSQFLANMSHEIRTPIGVILGFSDLALESLSKKDEVEKYISSIRRNAEQLSELVGEILDLSKVEAKKLDIESVRFSLRELVADVQALLEKPAADKGIELEFAYEGGVPEIVESDPTRLRQILINLIGNAIKFTSQGRVSVHICAERAGSASGLADSVPSKLAPSKLELSFEVTDTGIGISAENQDRLFKAFSQADSSMTRKFGGTGLGLMISRELTRALGGDLKLKASVPGKGSTFVASVKAIVPAEASEQAGYANFQEMSQLPQSQEPKRAAFHRTQSAWNASRKVPPPRLTDLHILLVEDAPDNQVLVSRYINPTGACLEVADNGAIGVEKATHGNFDLVLMDIQMPLMDGFCATRILRSQGYSKPIIALTAHAVQDEREKALRSGFDDYVTKPIARAHLYEILSRIWNARQQSANEAVH